MKGPLIIAVDGPAASGKGTLAERIAAHFGLAYLDTGQLYRAVASKVLAAGDDPANAEIAARAAETLAAEDLKRDDLRAAPVAAASSVVAAVPAVRAALLDWQRSFAEQGAVLDGRDIGTVVCPDAAAKLFITANAEIRADRRWRQRLGRGEEIAYETVLEDIRVRDARDSGRDHAPLKAAGDALLLDTTNLDIEAAVAQAIAMIESRLDAARSG